MEYLVTKVVTMEETLGTGLAALKSDRESVVPG